MTQKLWQKGEDDSLPEVTTYMLGDDLICDNQLVPYDVRGSIAHAQMLGKVGLLSGDEVSQLTAKLEEITALHGRGEFVVHAEDEDMHTAIENYLVKELGDTGKRIHVGRSRNDQVLTAVRLYSKDSLDETKALTKGLAETILSFAKTHEFVPMAGFTHMQHAMPSSVGQWAGAFVESLINDYEVLEAALKLNDQNPLGSAAGFGTGMALDREETTRTLDFDRVQVNPIYCQNSRGKIEAFTVSALLQVMMTLGKIANDLVIFSSQEFSFFKVDGSLSTGSSIMPQKRNLDIMETMRANVAVMQGLQLQCQGAGLNLISGYNKDLQVTKKALMDSFTICRESLKIADLVFRNLQPNEEGLAHAFEDTEIYAADYANKLVEDGVAFRDAYREVGKNLSELEGQDPAGNIRGKTHLGATGNLGLARYEDILKEL